MKIVTAGQMKTLDEKMIRERGVSALSLMEKAGAGVADVILDLLSRASSPQRVALFAGRGNNGGDAFVSARILEEKGIKTHTFLLASPDAITGEAKESLKKLASRGSLVSEIKSGADLDRALSNFGEFSVAVDGLVGTGSKGPLQGLFAETAERINAMGELGTCRVVAIDIPSGLDPDRGCVEGPAVKADHTVTLGLPKLGLILGEGLEYSGRLHWVDLGIPKEFLEPIEAQGLLLARDILTLPQKRRRLSHKGDFGHLFILGGSPGLTGAPALAAMAASRSGSGLVTVGISEGLNPILEAKLTEPMTLPLPENGSGFLGLEAMDAILRFLNRAAAVVIGPGLSTRGETAALIHKLLPQINIPTVIDADGLNAVSSDPSILKKMKAPVVLTPHPGEMARLLKKAKDQIQAHRWETARAMAQEFGVLTVLKGAGTVIANPEGPLFVNATGNPGLATGGTGDVLAGMLGAFLAQGMNALEAAKLAVYLHGAAADEAALTLGFEQGLLASDILDFIPKKLSELQQRKEMKHAA